MLMRSVTPAHGVGRFASTRDACVAVKTPVNDEYQDGPDRVEAEPLSERRRAKPDGEQNQEAVHARDRDVHGVGTRLLAPRQRLASVHWEQRRGQVAGPESHEEDSRDTQAAMATSRLPDAQSERDDERSVRGEKRNYKWSRRRVDCRQLADGLRAGAVIPPAPSANHVGRDIEKRRNDPAADQNPSRHCLIVTEHGQSRKASRWSQSVVRSESVLLHTSAGASGSSSRSAFGVGLSQRGSSSGREHVDLLVATLKARRGALGATPAGRPRSSA